MLQARDLAHHTWAKRIRSLPQSAITSDSCTKLSATTLPQSHYCGKFWRFAVTRQVAISQRSEWSRRQHTRRRPATGCHPLLY